MSLLGKTKDIVSHYPLVAIYSSNNTFTVSVDTDTEDLNRQPKNIKIASDDIQELTLDIKGFEELEAQEGGKYFTCSGNVELVNSGNADGESRYTLANPKIKVYPAKKRHLPPTSEIKQLVRNVWLDAYSDACQNINAPMFYNEESKWQRFKNSTLGKFILVVVGVFVVMYIALAALGAYKNVTSTQDPNVQIANQIANDPKAAEALLKQLEQQQGQQPDPAAQAQESERKEEIGAFGLDAGISEE